MDAALITAAGGAVQGQTESGLIALIAVIAIVAVAGASTAISLAALRTVRAVQTTPGRTPGAPQPKRRRANASIDAAVDAGPC